jgi:hypothetical protein
MDHPVILIILMENLNTIASAINRDRDAMNGSAPDLYEYYRTHKVQGVPLLGRLELTDCTRLILYNVQGFTVRQVWTELIACLGELARSIVKIKHVSHLNRNPHMILWVRKDAGAALISVIRQQNKKRLRELEGVVAEARRQHLGLLVANQREGNGARFTAVQHWRVALWQPWQERRMTPANSFPFSTRRVNLTAIATWNVNGFWAKSNEIAEFLFTERVAIFALQETLVGQVHYPVRLDGYRSYQSSAEEDFRGTALLIDKELASYEVPHGLNWLTHVKVFGYAGWPGPLHIISVYLKSGGNHRRTRGDSLETVKRIVNQILRRDDGAKFVILGDFNEEVPKVMKHLERGEGQNPLIAARIAGSTFTRFPANGGQRRALNHILLTRSTSDGLRSARVHREYSLSDHRLVVVRPKVKLPTAIPDKTRTSFDNKMIRLKGDLVANDNSWRRLMTSAYGEDFLDENPEDNEIQGLVTDQANDFIATFDQVCRKHSVKTVHRPKAKQNFPRKLRKLLQVVKRYSAKCNKTQGVGRVPEELDVIQLARAQARFKKARRAWRICMRQKFYSHVADDFVANDHKQVWNRLRSQVSPTETITAVNPVKDKDGELQYKVEDIVGVVKKHYEDVFTYDPDEASLDFEHWEKQDMGEPKPQLIGLNDGLYWPKVLDTIRGMNRNTAPGKDEIHINVIKTMVLEECMAEVQRENPGFQRPDFVRIDLPYKKLPTSPRTPLGKAFHCLLINIWHTQCIPDQWNEVIVSNLYKGGTRKIQTTTAELV